MHASGLKASGILLLLAKTLSTKKQSLSTIIKGCFSEDNTTTKIFLDNFGDKFAAIHNTSRSALRTMSNIDKELLSKRV